MKKVKCKTIKTVLVRLGVCALVVALVVLVPTLTILSFNELYLYNKFVGNVSSVKGVLEIWNVDSFDGGYYSKGKFLEKISVQFSREYKGVHFLVQSYTPQEAQALWEQGKRPALLSFGAGSMGEISSSMANITNLSQTSGGKAIAWCVGAYGLFSRSSYLQSAGISSYTSLQDIMFKAGYTQQQKNTSHKIYSLGYSNVGYVCPSWVIRQATQVPSVAEEISPLAQTATAFEMYTEFLNHSFSILLGSHRDAVRLESRIQAGKIDDICVDALQGVQALVQYISIVQGNAQVEDVCQLFIQFLTSTSVQTKLQGLGMFSPYVQNLYTKEQNPLLFVLEQSVHANTNYLPAFLTEEEFLACKQGLTKNNA